MGTKPANKVSVKVTDESAAPFSGDVQSPDELRDPQIASAPDTTFDERTKVLTPMEQAAEVKE